MKENDFIGLSWSILDFDGSGRDGHFNLSHNVNMVKDASYLCAFKLMPIEDAGGLFGADWTYQIIDMKEGWVAFKDCSLGAITKWTWDFGDGSKVVEGFVSIHLYTKPGEYNPTDTICKQNLVLQKKVSYSGSSCLGKEILCGFRIRK